MGDNIGRPKPWRTDSKTFWITAEKYVRGKRTRERGTPLQDQSACSWVRGPSLGIRASLGKCKEKQDTVENTRARINTGVNTYIYVLSYTFSSFMSTSTDSFPHNHKRKLISFRSGFLHLSSTDIWRWITLHEHCLVYCRIFSSMPGLDPLLQYI